MMSFVLPELPYGYTELEPHIDALTMQIHHQRHHQNYINQLNNALAGTAYASWSLEALLKSFEQLPAALLPAVRDHGGGHHNHSLFWTIMSPQGGGDPSDGDPSDALAAAMQQAFGDMAAFRAAFTKAALSRFGSGWAWLVLQADGQLAVTSTANQDSPLLQQQIPLLGLDVWEHAYYLQYQNKRPDYIAAFYQVIHWPEVSRRYQLAIAEQAAG
jgi:Fe-Mn family superoxide dismutase